MGILLPFFFLLFFPKSRSPEETEVLSPVPPWAWALVALFAVFLRFYRLTSLSSWPLYDEGMFGYYATRLETHWDWRLVRGFAGEPALYAWGQSLFFKLIPDRLEALWLFPAVCSLLCVATAAWTAKKTSSSPLLFFVFTWISLGFWPLYIGRFSAPYILMILFECIVLSLLYAFLSGKPPRAKFLLILSICAGLGFYTYLAWTPVALLTLLVLLTTPGQSWSKRLQLSLFFLAVTLLIAFPFFLNFSKNYKGYLNYLWAGGTPRSWVYYASFVFQYLRDVFWGKPGGLFRYGPHWGGILNPLASSLFILGLSGILATRKKLISLWLCAGLVLFLLPSFLTNSLQLMRIASLLPLMVLVCAYGTRSLLSMVSKHLRWGIFLLVTAGSVGLDSYHLFSAYPKVWETNPAFYSQHKCLEFQKAFSLLKPLVTREGPGLILLNFIPDPYDQTLFVATYSFNAASNPVLDASRARWAALLTNIHEEPYLSREFPGGKWVWLSEGLKHMDGGFLLETIPLTPKNTSRIQAWAKADHSLGEMTYEVMETGVNPDQNSMLDLLNRIYPLFRGDPFLESRYWRIRAVHAAAGQKIGEAEEDEFKAIHLGLPMSHLYNELGCLFFKDGKKEKARRAFEAAMSLKPNCTDAVENLKNLALIK